MDDKQLISLLNEGNTKAYTEIYTRYFDRLYNYANRLNNQDVAKDVIQDIFSTLWEKKEQIIIKGNIEGYLYAAVRNRIFDLNARRHIERCYIESIEQFSDRSENVTDHIVHERDLTTLIDGVITGFPVKMRRVFEMSRKNHFTHREIATELNISEQTVRAHIKNSLKRLRRSFTSTTNL
jgi:RNA polymerase sigma-70 factor (family 1)